jgi:HlyD family secretion protein
MTVRLRHGRRRTAWVASAVVLGLAAIGLTAGRALAGGAGTHYRLATASIGSVDQTLTEVGTVSAVNRATLSFPVAGTVSSVAVGVGSRVAAGQVLASLDTTALSQQLASANSTLASAQQTLAADEASQTGTSSSSSQTGGETTATLDAVRLTAAGTPTSRPSAGGSSGSSIGKLAAAVTVAQQAVLAAQQALDADLAAAEQALASCRAALSEPSSPAPSATASASPTASADPTASASTTATATSTGDSGSAQCLAAIGQAPGAAQVAADQQARIRAERTLDAAVRALTSAAGKAAAGSSGTGKSGTGSSGTGKSATGTSGTGSSRTGSSGSSRSSAGSNSASGRTTGGPATAAQLAADQAQIDAAQAQVQLAQQNLAATVLTSPLTGTVAAVSIVAGRSVGGSATGSSITVIGQGTEQVSTTVGLADIDSVHVGESATVRVDGVGGQLTGTVSNVGVLNSTSGSSTSYPVTIRLDPTSARLFDGSGASVQIEVARVSGVLTVPSSAVHTFGQLHTVEVLTNGKPTQVRVTVGAVGSDRTQISSGLKAGQQVVLADLATPLPTSG